MPVQPTGTVTFLFTDIEGSTARWERHRAAMTTALERHDALLRQQIEAHGGYVFKTVGDAFCAAFPTALLAVDAAVAAQRALATEPWPPECALRVRMALHTGIAEPRAGDYVGLPLNRVARLLAVAHGGQTLLSLATQQQVRDLLPPDIALRDLGEQWLKDLVRPERVYQLLAPDLPQDFPPIQPGPAAPADPAQHDSPVVGNPYKGLRAFQEADAPDFFGREALARRLTSRLSAADALSRFLAVVGPSGSGKSSVVRAGLLPALRNDALPMSGRWPIAQMVPGSAPFEELEAALLRVAINPPASLLPQLLADERGLLRAVNRVLPPEPAHELVLLIDQFEELFTLVPDEALRRQFLASLCAAVSDPRSRLWVVVTLRADFYDRPLLYPDPGELIRQRTEVVLPLTADELYRAITAPAQRVGVGVEPQLLTVLLQDVGEQPGTLPLLQYALTELFDQRSGPTLTLDGYHARGGVVGALSRRADELYAELAPADQALATQLFLRLITLGEGVEDTRRRAQTAELESLATEPARVHRVLEHFGRYRLLTFDRHPVTGERSVEVAHEALIQRWERLREWLDHSREELRLQRRLAAAAAEWTAVGRDPSYLATGARLVQFVELAANPKVSLNDAEQTYIQTSVADREQRERAEHERQARELALAQQAERAQRRAADRFRLLAAVLIVFLVVALGLSFVAVDQRRQAVANLTRTEAQRLAGEATTLLGARDNSDVIALLTIRSLHILYTPQGAAALEGAAALSFPRQQFAGHTGTIRSVVYSPDGRTILTGGDDKTARLWDAATGKQLRVFEGHTAEVWDVAFAPDGRTVLTGSVDTTTRLWDAQTGALVRTFAAPKPVESVAFSPDGAYVLVGYDDNRARLWDTRSGAEVREFTGHTAVVAAVAYSHDGRTILTGSVDKTARLWDAATGALLQTFRGHTGNAWNLAFSPDDTLVATGSTDRTARLWDVKTGKELRRFTGHTNFLSGVAFSPDGRTLLTGGQDKTARLWNVATGAELQRFTGHTSMLWDVAYAPDGASVLTGGFDHVARIWDVAGAGAHPQFAGHEGKVAAVSPDGNVVLTGGDDATGWLWDAHTGQALRPLVGHTDGINGVAFSPDSTKALTGSADQTARLWDVATGRELQRFVGHGDFGVQAVTFSPDGKYVLTGGIDFTARLWDAATGAQLRVLHHTSNVYGVAFSPDGRLLLTGAFDKTARIWDAGTGAEIRVLTMPSSAGAASVAFSPDGTQIVTGSWEGPVHLWATATGALLRSFAGHSDTVWAVAFSPDGKSIVTGSQDTTARLWEVASGRELRRFGGNPGAVDSAVFMPDTQTVLLGRSGSTAWLSDVDYTATIRYLCGRLLRDLSAAERSQYSIDDAAPTCPQPQTAAAGDTGRPQAGR